MQFKTLLATVLTIGFLTVPALAGEGRARIDLTVKAGELKITPSDNKNVRIMHASWVKEEDKKKMYVTTDLMVSDEKWTEVTIEVTPTEDGILTIALRGQYDKEKRNWSYFDDITAEGATIKNSSFEETGGWNFPKGQQVLDESLAHTGKGAVLVWHDKAAYQGVAVKADVPVKITSWIKFCKKEDKEPK
jgi:hypothetical protein